MRQKIAVVAITLLFGLGHAVNPGRAAVVVLANRTAETVSFHVVAAAGASRSYTLPKGDVMALPLTSALEVVYSAAGTRHRRRTGGNEIYYFVGDAKTLRLEQAGFHGAWGQPQQAAAENDADSPDWPAGRSHAERGNENRLLLRVPVKILVDQAEPTVQHVWEKRLRKRIKDASDILERYCRVRFEVMEAETWKSDDKLTKLSELLRDFRDKVAPGKVRLVLGFTGLRQGKNEDAALGCTPAPLHTHILLREYKSRTEAKRLEVLVHELGHFLGACHSPEGDSVMRPKLGDGRANLRDFRIGFDPINTLVMNLVAEELARRPLRRLDQLSPRTRKRLLDIFSIMARTAPDEPSSAAYFFRLLGGKPHEAWTVRSLPPAMLDAARAVVSAITADAKHNQQRSRGTDATPLASGDALTERYFRVAAAECRRLPAEHAATAYVLGLAVALDCAALLRSLGLRDIAWEKIESDAERQQRRKVLGEPTIYGRASLMQRFVVSAAVLMLVEGQDVSAAGIQEELLRLEGGRFHFDDLGASLAGFAFVTQLLASPALFDELATSFRISDYFLSPKGLPDPLDYQEFHRQYGSTTDERFLNQQDVLHKRLMALPGYQPHPPRKQIKD